MTIAETLKGLIHDSAHLSLDISPNNKNASLIIKETDRSASLRHVTLHGLSTHATFAWRLDCKEVRCGTKHKLSPYFKNGKGLENGCDAIIVTNIESQWYIFIVELKSNPKRKIAEMTRQFKSSLCFVKYIQAIMCIVYPEDNVNEVQVCCVLFSHSGQNSHGVKNPQGNIVNEGKRNLGKDIDGKPIKHLKATDYCNYDIKKLL